MYSNQLEIRRSSIFKLSIKLAFVDALILVVLGYIIPNRFGPGLVNSLELFNKIIGVLLNSGGSGIIGITGLIIFIATIYYILNKNNYHKANSFIKFIVAFIISIFILMFIIFFLGTFFFTGFGLFK